MDVEDNGRFGALGLWLDEDIKFNDEGDGDGDAEMDDVDDDEDDGSWWGNGTNGLAAPTNKALKL